MVNPTNNPKLLTSIVTKLKASGWNKTQATLAQTLIEDYFGLHTEVGEVTAAHFDGLKTHLKDKGLSDASINRYTASISKLIKHAMQRPELYEVYRMPYIEYISVENERDRYLSEDEEKEMIQCYQDKGWHDTLDFTLFMLDTGMRKGEGLGFTAKQVHTHKNTEGRTRMYVRLQGNTSTKKHKRVVPLTTRARNIVEPLLANCEPDDVVFDLNYWTVSNRFDYVKGMMGLEEDKGFVFHTLRHTYASRLVQKGVPLYTVGSLLGHTNPRMTQRYAHFAPEHLLDAVDVLQETETVTKPIDNVDAII